MVAGEEELLGRQAPHSLEAEQSVLGAMLIDSRCVADVIGLLKPEDFYLQQNREIYETIYAMFNFSQVIDPVTVLDKMQERGVWQDRSIEYIKQLMEITPTSANAVRYASIVRDKALLRSLATAASEISETVYEGVGTPAEILESAPCAKASGGRAWSPSAWCSTRSSTASRSWPNPTATSRACLRAS